ncbi:hypothetical protein RN001_003621 [Aquatica leii]|uniref:Uncharacterized protein n=1 Tax=Aquatica leii TaxID=1421715 RepID=A0AAN7PFB9_9COLE|nr:hypothetical protein RN001_003621 [Aquatica leii]
MDPPDVNSDVIDWSSYSPATLKTKEHKSLRAVNDKVNQKENMSRTSKVLQGITHAKTELAELKKQLLLKDNVRNEEFHKARLISQHLLNEQLKLKNEILRLRLQQLQKIGHGKGAPDGIGATCKRTADAVVATGGDIDSMESFVEAIQRRCPAITLFTIDNKAIQELTDDLQNDAVNLKSFNGTLKIHQVKAELLRCPLESAPSAVKVIMKSLSCTCEGECQHFNLGVLECKNETELNVDDIYTDSESDNMNNPQDSTMEADDAALAGHSSINQQNYTIGDCVLVKFIARNTEYRYAAVINKIDTEEGELTVTFLKIRDDKDHTFRVDENDVSDVSFDQVLQKLPNPNIALKGK